MTLIKQVFEKDPTSYRLPNNGVAMVNRLPEHIDSDEAKKLWEVARYECESFVCEGSYQEGLQKILKEYLKGLNMPSQKAAWVHGFYGSGKSHLVRMLQFLWTDLKFPDGATARGLVNIPADIRDYFKELSTIGTQEGGLWTAAGRMLSGGSDARATILNIILQSAGIPERPSSAKFDIWLRRNDWRDTIVQGLADEGESYELELDNLHVSDALAR